MSPHTPLKVLRSSPATFDGTVVAVTGSIGKSTTARLIVSVLGQHLQGVTLSRDLDLSMEWEQLFARTNADHDFAVVELSAEGSRDTQELAAWRTPWAGVVTQRFETLDAAGWLARESATTSALLESLPTDGWAILDGDDRLLRQWEAATNARIIRVGRGSECDLIATDIRNGAEGLEFVLEGRRFFVPLRGRHLLHPVLSALAVGRVFGVSMADMAANLAELQNREPIAGPSLAEVTVLTDDRRHTPDAVRSGLRALHDAPTTGRRVVVCGELEAASERDSLELYRQLGAAAVTVAGADCLMATGRHGEQLLDGAREAGMPSAGRIVFRHPRELPKLLGRHVKPGDSVLIRGRVENSGAPLFRGLANLSRMAA